MITVLLTSCNTLPNRGVINPGSHKSYTEVKDMYNDCAGKYNDCRELLERAKNNLMGDNKLYTDIQKEKKSYKIKWTLIGTAIGLAAGLIIGGVTVAYVVRRY